MYAFFKGTLYSAMENYAIVECGGIGYKIFVPRRFLNTAPVGEQVMLYTHLIVREAELSLYGFESEADKKMFERLIGISGIGPKAGLAILSQMNSDEVARAVFSGDTGAFSKVSGIGKKTSERIVLELKDKLDIGAAWGNAQNTSDTPANALQEAAEALINLGYQKAEAAAAVRSVAALADSAEELVLLALRRLDVR